MKRIRAIIRLYVKCGLRVFPSLTLLCFLLGLYAVCFANFGAFVFFLLDFGFWVPMVIHVSSMPPSRSFTPTSQHN